MQKHRLLFIVVPAHYISIDKNNQWFDMITNLPKKMETIPLHWLMCQEQAIGIQQGMPTFGREVSPKQMQVK